MFRASAIGYILILIRLGIGVLFPKDVTDGSFKHWEFSSNDKLLKQLLRKKVVKAVKVYPTANSLKFLGLLQNLGSKSVKPLIYQEESEDEEGWASIFKLKRTKQKNILELYF